MFLHCNGYKKQPQKDCRTYLPDGKLTYANRYAIRSLSFDVDEIKNSFNNAAIFADFSPLFLVQYSEQYTIDTVNCYICATAVTTTAGTTS
ncbi:MAG: hypothetical protein DLM72_11510 [Candidatus Nitrosopolaris wilkensis]|nr:MAG: hypothetical protein DLM72_11510 [Candidatus Nitrosopolaris wilkensis]